MAPRQFRRFLSSARVTNEVVRLSNRIEPGTFGSETKRLAEGHLRSRGPLRVLLLTSNHRCLRLEGCRVRRNWTAAEWNQVVFSDESRFNLSSDDNRVHVWRPNGERLNPAFALQRHTTPTVGVMVWVAIAYNSAPQPFYRCEPVNVL
ncbi:transposable element Tcb1 transposase [Trichonephila clavipes]|nr:transposable element Tcb1 transposase [Trichonephila clavipes]